MICLRNQTILISRGFQFVPILGPNRSFSHVKKRKSNWVSIEIRLSEFKPISFVKRSMAMESASKSNCGTSTFILTSGVSGRVNALFSLRMWKSLLVLINAFVLVILLPFRCWKRAVVVTSSSSSSSSMEKMKNERSERKGPVVRVPAAIVSRRSGSSGGISMVAIDQTVAARRALAIRRVIQDNDGDSIRNFSLFVTSRGDTIFTQSWTPVSIKIRGLVVLVHGLNEHCDRYNDFSKELNANGLKVYGMDWIGHGGSDGLHAYIHSLDYAVSDMKSFLEKVLAENPGLPCFCFGHSTGGAIVLKALLDSKVEARVAGVVVTSPAVGVQPSHPIFAVLAPILSFLLPRYQLAAANKKGMPVSRDPEALVSKYSDPLVYTGSIRARTGYEILRISSFLLQNMQRLRVPFLVLHGTADTVTDPKASKKLYEEAFSTDKTIKLLDGLLHDLLFEPEREEIMRDIIEWFSCRIQC